MLEWKKDGWKALLVLAPALIILAIFTFYPIINTIILSFFPEFNLMSFEYGKFGFEAYHKVLTDRFFWRAMGNTAIMVFVSVPLSIIISLLLSVALNSIKKLQGVFQTIFFLPYVTNSIAFGLVFLTIFSSQSYGLINTILGWFGTGPVAWTGGEVTYWKGIFVLTVYSVWNSLAFKILVFLGGLQGIDKQYYQAAQIDETPKWRVFTRITVPLLSPMITYITITSLIGAFKAYSSVVAVFGEAMGPGQSRMFETAVGYIYYYFQYRQTENGSIPYASASALLLFIFIMLLTLGQLAYNKRRNRY